ncbi:MAG: hypothetical protein RBT70_09350 [Alphaproteobacteria bacterium]|jgi:hypothetical protein|nr:hypothetical protein [Alphaproteobacteria bacterium]
MAKGKKTGGRRQGTPNKTTQQARLALADFIEDNVESLNEWLDRMAKDNPESAFKAFMSVLEYNIPKLARVDHDVKQSGDIVIMVSPHDADI